MTVAITIAGICLLGAGCTLLAMAVYLRRERRKRQDREWLDLLAAMAPGTTAEPAAAVLDRIRDSVAADVLQPDYPIELVDAEIRAAGGDPEAIGERGRVLVAGLLGSRRAAMALPPAGPLERAAVAHEVAGLRPQEVLALSAQVEPMGPPPPPRLRPPEARAPAELHPVGWRRNRNREVPDA